MAETIKGYTSDTSGKLRFELIAKIKEDRIKSYGWRSHSNLTQVRQDKTLQGYYQFTRLMNDLPPDTGIPETEAYAFPLNHDDLGAALRDFITFIYTHSKGRMRKTGFERHMDYTSLIPYRSHMTFWINRKYAQAGNPVPYYYAVYNHLTEAMQYCQSVYGTRKRREPKAGLGLHELREILEYEMTQSPSPALSQQHQLIMCLLRQTAVRPGSIGNATYRKDQYLAWKDVRIINHGSGVLTARISFEHLKTNYDDPQEADHRTLIMNCDTPNAENMIFSVPHRFMCIALSRNAIENHNTIEQVLDSTFQHIRFKAEFLSQPVFFAGLPGGRGIRSERDEDGNYHPVSASQITAYISDRGRRLGYTQPVTAYSFRRRTATDLVSRIGYKLTREIMGHAPDTMTLERYYVDFSEVLNLTSATLNQSMATTAIDRQKLLNLAQLSTTALTQAQKDYIEGSALTQLVNKLINEDDEDVSAMDVEQLKTYKKRVRAYARRVLREQVEEEQKKVITIQDVQARQDLLAQNAALFAKTVQTRARQLMATKTSDNAQVEGTASEDEEEDPFEIFDDEDGEPLLDVDETDAERYAETASEQTVTHTVTGEEFNGTFTTTSPIEQKAIVRAFMEILMTNSLSKAKPWSERNRQCQLCIDDMTTSEADREKSWQYETKLNDHMTSGQFHSPFGVWCRMQKSLANIGMLCTYIC